MVAALDGSAKGTSTANTSTVVTGTNLVTTNATDVIIAYVGVSLSTETVSSITGGGLTWVFKNSWTNVANHLEEWYTTTSSTVNAAMTANFSSPTSSNGKGIAVFGISGANTASPFDGNASLESSVTGVTNPLTYTYSTTNANCFVFACESALIAANGLGPYTGSAGTWTEGPFWNNGGGATMDAGDTAYFVSSSAASNATIKFGGTQFGNVQLTVDAVVATSGPAAPAPSPRASTLPMLGVGALDLRKQAQNRFRMPKLGFRL